jgi:hypothetical protein
MNRVELRHHNYVIWQTAEMIRKLMFGIREYLTPCSLTHCYLCYLVD